MTKIQFQANKPLSQLSTFGIGGPARFFTEVQKIEELQSHLKYCHEQKLLFSLSAKAPIACSTIADSMGL